MTTTRLADRLDALRLDRLGPIPGEPVPSVGAVPAVRSRPRRWTIAAALAAVPLAAAIYGISVAGTRPADDGRPSAAPMAPTAPPPAAAPGRLVASGYVVPRRGATVGSQVTGVIRAILVAEGELVAAGQPLARLDDSTARAALGRAHAQIRMARAQVAALNAQYHAAAAALGRKNQLAERGFVTIAAVEASQADVGSLSARIAEAEANVAAMEALARSAAVDLERTVIRAPFSGVVVTKNAEVGEVVSPVSAGGGFTRTGILTLVDMASLGADVEVSEAHVARIRAGQPVRLALDALPDTELAAVVSSIVPSADRSRATVRVRIDLVDRDPRVLPQMAVRANFVIQEAMP